MKATMLIENISQLITMKGKNGPRQGREMSDIGLVENAIVAIAGDRIAYAGSGPLPNNIAIDQETIIIDARGKLVTPGLIDSHTHLVHGGSRENELEMKLKGLTYLDILNAGGGIHSTVKATKDASKEDLYKKAKKSLDIMLSYGVTTVEAKSGYGIDDFETEIKQMEVVKELDKNHPVDLVSTFMGAHAIPKAYKDRPDDFVDIIVNDNLERVKSLDLGEFCDVFCEEGVFTIAQSRRILEKAKSLGFGIKIHADEVVDLGGAKLAGDLGCVSAEHLMASSDEGLLALVENQVVANLLPGTSFNLQSKDIARARYIIDQGGAVALSTDYNPGSCPTENLQLIMTLGALMLKMTPKEVITAVTINGAAALNRQEEIGSLETGKKADLAIFDASNLNYIIYHFGINHTWGVIKSGNLVYKR